MSEEEIKQIIDAKRKPVASIYDLNIYLRGRRNCFIFVTENFRKEFENKMSKLGSLEYEIERLREVIELQQKEIDRLQIEKDDLIMKLCFSNKNLPVIYPIQFPKIEPPKLEYPNFKHLKLEPLETIVPVDKMLENLRKQIYDSFGINMVIGMDIGEEESEDNARSKKI